MLVILPTWEAEIRRITVWGQHRQKVNKTPSQSIAGCDGMCLSPQTRREVEIRSVVFLGKLEQKCLQDSSSMENSWAWWCMSIIPVVVGKIGRSQCRLAWEKARPYLQKNQSRKGWRQGSSSRVPTLHVQNPNLNPSTAKINK
jgi:hypothetical protein